MSRTTSVYQQKRENETETRFHDHDAPYMLMMDEERLNEFDVCIIDEDIFFKTIITSQKRSLCPRCENCGREHRISCYARK